MAKSTYRDRQVHVLENDRLAVIVTVEGGHIAALTEKRTGVNPLWSPPWPTIEPSAWSQATHPEYGSDAESPLLSGILGHNLCLDLFGAPTAEEAAAGMTAHGEASIRTYDVDDTGRSLLFRVDLPIAQLHFERLLELPEDSDTVKITETVTNLTGCDRPIAWTQHVTLGAPFVEPGKTRFACTATRSQVFPVDFTNGFGYLQPGAEFEWPLAPGMDGKEVDMRTYVDLEASGAYTAHLMDAAQEYASFSAWNPDMQVACGYRWKTADFPWMGIWEENRSRAQSPWNGETVTRGMEFGVSPYPESRRHMIDRKEMYETPVYRWLPAKKSLQVTYEAWCRHSPEAPSE